MSVRGTSSRPEDQAALQRTLADLDRLGVEPLDVWDEAMFGFVVALDAAEMEYVRASPGRGDRSTATPS